MQIGLGVEVPDAGRRERPAVGRGDQERLEHGQPGLLPLTGRRDPSALQPAQQGCDVLASPPGQGIVDLDVGVDARHHPSEHLEQCRVAVGQRGVALLGGQHQRWFPERQLGSRLGVEGQAVDAVLRVETVQEFCGGVLVVQRVVGVAALRLPDENVIEAAVGNIAKAHRYLVDLPAIALDHLDQQVPDLRVGLAQARCGHGPNGADRLVLAREPALVGQPRCQQRDGAFDVHATASRCARTSRNQ